MGIGHSTFYDTPDAHARDLTIVAEMKTICDEFEAYGYRQHSVSTAASYPVDLIGGGVRPPAWRSLEAAANSMA